MNNQESHERDLQIRAIQQTVAQAFGLSIGELIQSNMARGVAVPRQIAIYLAKHLTDASLPEIGRCFGKHHTTVMHSIFKIEEQRQSDPSVDKIVRKLLKTLKTS